MTSVYSDVKAHSAEVKSGTDTTISCVISGIKNRVTVEWLLNGASVSVISSDSRSSYTSNTGSVDADNMNSQTATLNIEGSAVKKDGTYTCRVQSELFSESPTSDTVVYLYVYGWF